MSVYNQGCQGGNGGNSIREMEKLREYFYGPINISIYVLVNLNKFREIYFGKKNHLNITNCFALIL